MPIIRCPSCDDRVEIEDDWYGRRIACPNCDKTFTPERERGGDRPRRAADDDRDDDRPRRRSRDDDDRDDDRRPARSRSKSRYDDDPPKKKGSPVGWIILGLVGVFVVLPCVSCVGFFVWAGTAKESFNDQWADGSVGTPAVVTASFPKPPTSKYPSVTGAVDSQLVGYSNQIDGDKVLDANFAVGYFDFPAGTRDPLTTQHAAIRKEIEEKIIDDITGSPRVARETMTTVGGYPAKETVYAEESGEFILRVIHLNDRPPGQPVRLAVVVAGGPHLKPEDQQKFLNSVKIGKK